MGIRLIAAMCLATVLSLAAPPSTAQKKPDKRKEAEELLARVQAATDIRAAGSPPFRLRARVLLDGMEGGKFEGTYLLQWAAPNQWREEMAIGDYNEVRVLAKDTLWVKRNAAFVPYLIEELRHVLLFHREIKLLSQEKIQKVTVPKDNPHATCVALRRGSRDRELCFSSDPERLITSHTRMRVMEELSSTNLSNDYLLVGNKLHPRTLTYLYNGKKLIEMTVEELSASTFDLASLIAPLAGGRAWTWCDDMKWPTYSRNIYDELYPRIPYGHDWRFAAYAVISADGKATDIQLVRNDQPALEKYALEALRRASFTPATCGGKPVVTEHVFSFGLGKGNPTLDPSHWPSRQ